MYDLYKGNLSETPNIGALYPNVKGWNIDFGTQDKLTDFCTQNMLGRKGLHDLSLFFSWP